VDTALPLRFVMVVGGYPPKATAGMERGCQRLSRALAARGHTVHVLTAAVPGLPAQASEAGVLVHRVIAPWPIGPLWGLTYMWLVRRWLFQHDWDVVMCHQLFLHSPIANRVAATLGRRAIHLLVAAQSQSDIGRLQALAGGRWLTKQAVTGAGLLFALSDESAKELLEAGAPPERIRPYRYFVGAEEFRADEVPRTEEALFIGRFHEQKNLPLLLDAFDACAGDAPGMHLRLIGAGPRESEVRTRVADSPYVSRISIEPWSARPAEAYLRAAFLVMSSDAEGLSNVLLEAMACGLPVVSTDVSGAREALGVEAEATIPKGAFVRGVAGLLTTRGDVAGLAAAMRQLMTQPALRVELGTGARARAENRYSEDVCVTDFLEHVRRLLAPPGA
jgi:glycosyltransferase involved in cell wall biosynthesis